MSVRSISRHAIGAGITLARMPLEIATSLTPGRGAERASSTAIALDRLEARVRDVAGMALGDDVLREDAALRRVAADERERALRLRSAADDRAQEADEQLQETQQQAEERRKVAARRARSRRETATSKRAERSRDAVKVERRRKASSAKARAKNDEAIGEKAAAARLRQLEREAAVLDQKAGAITAEAEAQRLQDAATRKKAARKKR